MKDTKRKKMSDGSAWWVPALLLSAVLVAQVLVYKPFFGHMDDGRLLALVAEGGWLDNIQDFALAADADFGYRGARAFSMLLVLPIYELGENFGAVAFYVMNVLVVIAIITSFMVTLQRNGLFAGSATAAAVTAAFVWPFTVELIFYPSLQEKGIVLAVAILFWWIQRSATVRNDALFWLGTVLFFALTAMSKTQVIVFLPAVAATVFAVRERFPSRTRPIGLIIAAGITLVFVIGAGLSGSYPVSARSGTVLSNLVLPYTLLMLAVTVAFATYLLIRVRSGEQRLLDVIPLVMMATMSSAVAYFGYRNYFLSIFGVMFGAAVAVLIRDMPMKAWRSIAMSALGVVTVAWLMFRIPQLFQPLHDIGAFTQSEIARDLALAGSAVHTSCVEGSGHFNRYAARRWGISPSFVALDGESAGYRFGVPDQVMLVFADRRLCPAPAEVANWEIVWASPGMDGFRLYRRPVALPILRE